MLHLIVRDNVDIARLTYLVINSWIRRQLDILKIKEFTDEETKRIIGQTFNIVSNYKGENFESIDNLLGVLKEMLT